MRNVFAFAWRALRSDARHHRASSVTLVIGAAMVVGAVLTGQAASDTLRGGIEALGGVGDVAVVPEVGAPALSASDVTAVEELPGVSLAIPTYSHETFVVRKDRPDVDGEDLTVTGVVASAFERLPGVLRSGRWPAHDDEVVVPDTLAGRLDVDRGDRVRVGAHDGGHELVVTGIAKADALGLFARDNVFSTVEGAWSLAGVSDEYTRVELMISASDRSAWAEQARAVLPAETAVQDTSAAVDALGPIARTTNVLVIATGVVAAIIAAVLAAATGSELRRRRRRTSGVLRAVGAPGGWVRRALLVEAATAGLVASTGGSGIGVVASAVAGRSTGGQWPSPTTALLVIGVVIATGTAVMAIATAAARETRPEAPRRAGGAAVVTLVVSGSAAVAGSLLPLGPTGDGAAVLGSVVAAGAGAVLVRRLIGRALGRAHWTASGLERSASTPVAVVVAVVTVFSAALLAAASGVSDATQRQITAQFGADVQVTSSTPLPRSTRDIVQSMPDVRAIADSSVATVHLTSRHGEADVPALGVDRTWFEVEDLAWRSGTPARARRAVIAGDGVAVPQSLAHRLGLAIGGRVPLTFGGHTSTATVAATFTSLATGDQIVVGPGTASALGFPAATGWDIGVTAGSDPVAVRDRVADVVESVPGAVAITAAEMRDRAGQQLVATFAGVFGLVGLAGVLSALGTAGAYRMVIDRRRPEFAVLRAIGVRRRDLRAIVRWEWAAAAIAAVVPAALLGSVAVSAGSHAVGSLLGVDVSVSSSLFPLAVAFLLITGTMALATAGPARAAATIPPAEALREDR